MGETRNAYRIYMCKSHTKCRRILRRQVVSLGVRQNCLKIESNGGLSC
jgi:hypothetical protein